MKSIHFATVLIVVIALFSCARTTPLGIKSSVTFQMNGDSASIIGLAVDTNRLIGFEYPQIIIRGIAVVPATHDSLVVQMQIFDYYSDLFSAQRLVGSFSDTSRNGHEAALDLNSSINFNDYGNAYNASHPFYTIVDSNDGKTIWGRFYGDLITDANNTGAPPVMPITNGKFKISY